MVIGLSRRNSVRRPSAYSEFGRQPSEGEAGFLHRVRLDGLRVGRCADDKKGDDRIRRYGDVCKLAEGVLCLPKQ